VQNFADHGIVIKILGDTKPLKQWEITGELRKRLKIAFDREGIEIPLPQTVIHQAE
jgi:small conductance mechanosensitive channel